MNANLVKATAVGALGGLLFGFDTAVIAGTTQQLTRIFALTDPSLGLTVSIALWGTVIGAMTAGVVGQRFGSREVLRLLAVFYVLSALGCALAFSWSILVFSRFLGGLGIGGSSVLGPVYIAELAPARLRGRLVGTFQINVVIGILLAYFSNYCIAELDLGRNDWRWMFGVAAVPAALFLIMLFGIPRSPRWLATQGRVAEGRSILEQMGAEDPDREMREIVNSIHLERQQKSESLWTRKYHLPIFLAVTIGVFNQLAGINAILYYLNDIFAAAGYSKVSGELGPVAVGAMNLAATLLAVTVIDRLGRKTLLLIGAVGLTGCLAALSAIFFTGRHQSALLLILICYIAFFAMSQGAVIWVYVGEVFPNRVRAQGQSVGSSSHWVMNAIVSWIFPVLFHGSHGLPFALFACVMLLQFTAWASSSSCALARAFVRSFIGW